MKKRDDHNVYWNNFKNEIKEEYLVNIFRNLLQTSILVINNEATLFKKLFCMLHKNKIFVARRTLKASKA